MKSDPEIKRRWLDEQAAYESQAAQLEDEELMEEAEAL